MNSIVRGLAAFTFTAALVACGGGHAVSEPAASASAPLTTAAVDIVQDSVCRVSAWQVAEGCTPGEKIVFLPDSWGNEQLPVMFAALNCDLRYQVVSTKGAVTCLFRPIKPVREKAAASGASR